MLKGEDFSYPPVKHSCYNKFIKNCHILSLYPEPVTLGHFLNNSYFVVSYLDSEKKLYRIQAGLLLSSVDFKVCPWKSSNT